MSTEALALAVVSTVRPTTAAAVYAMLRDGRPRRLLAAYLLAGMAVSLSAGIAVILLAGGTLLPRPPAGVRGVLLAALGACSLLAAVAVRLGWLRRFRPPEAAAAAPVHRLSPTGAATAGVVTHLPGVFYLAGLGAIAGTGAAAAGMVVQVLLYNLVWFAPALVALGICLFGTIPSAERWARAVSWGRQYQDPILTVCFMAVGVWLLVKGVADLGMSVDRSPGGEDGCEFRRGERGAGSSVESPGGMAMTTIDRAASTRQVYFHDPSAPAATVVVPSVFVAVRWHEGRLLLVRRCDSGLWELPGGRVDVGESAVDAAVREVAEEAGVHVIVTGFAGLFTDPGHVVRSPGGEVRQQFALLFRARAVGGSPRGDLQETSDAAWTALAELPRLPIEPPVRIWIAQALAVDEPPFLG